MSARKRNHEEDEDESLDGYEDDDSYSGEPPKRPRHDAADLVDDSQPMNEEDLATVRQHEMLEAERKRNERPENAPADGGIILSVVCQNFMCHGHLTCPLGPHMNFIIGHNGSGKSAILTALTLALGGKAAATNRGSSMKSFIKEGEDTARITVRLKNEGDGFKQEQYGNVIVIERTFSRDGGSSYKLKSQHGKTFSTKKDELDDICDFYGLQVDNPMTILTQDAAREFLSHSTNAQKYSFFAKGVQLEQLDADYSLINQSIKNIEAVLIAKKEAVETVKKKLENAKRKVEMFDQHDSLRDQMTELQYQMAWVQVVEAEREAEEAQKKVDTVMKNIGLAQEKVDAASERFTAMDQEVEAINQKLAEERVKRDPFAETLDTLKVKFEEHKKSLIEFQVRERDVKAELKKALKGIEGIKNKIQAEEDRVKAQDGGSGIKLVEEQREAEARKEELKEERDAMDEELRDLDKKLQDLEPHQSRLETEMNSRRGEVQNLRYNLDNLRRSDRTELSAFPHNTGQLVAAIERERGWREKPVGPIGRYVTLKDQKWMSIIERFFGGTLNGYVVTSNDDARRLRALMQQCKCQHPVFLTVPKQIRLDEPDDRYKTILRILEVNHDLARLQLIVSHGPEQAILIDELDHANEIMARRRPEDNIQQCFTINPQDKDWGYRVGGAIGAMGVTPVPPFNGASRMKTDRAAYIRTVEQQLHEKERQVQRLQGELNEINNERRQYAAQREDLRSKKRNLGYQSDKVDERIESIKARIEELSSDSNLGQLEQELTVAEEKKKSYESQYQELLVQRSQLNDEQNKVSAEMNSVKQDIDLVDSRCADIERDVQHADRKRQHALTEKNRVWGKLQEFKAVLEKFQTEAAEAQQHAQDNAEQASKICDRVDVAEGVTIETLDTRLKNIAAEIEAAERSLGGTREEVIAQFTKLNSEYESAQAQIEHFEAVITAATRVLRDRRARWKEFQKHISARARAQFMFMMSERAFKGRLRLEHNERPPELIIEVQPGGEDTGNRGPKTLSGGEKSFSTICLLLSLWEAMGSPIRCLDEFDVFMDPVNRSISVDMMIKAAERSIGKQFIMITPQNMSRASTTNAKIFRLSDPDRGTGQTRLIAQ